MSLEEHIAIAHAMRNLHPVEREIAILYAILSGVLLDARPRLPKRTQAPDLRGLLLPDITA